MASQMAILIRTRALLRVNQSKSISSFPFLSQEPQLAESAHSAETGETQTRDNLPSAIHYSPWLPKPIYFHRNQYLSQGLEGPALMNHFADLMTRQRWVDVKEIFEFWVRSLDKNGKPYKPEVNLYNHYLRANFMIGASASDLLDLVAQMEEFAIVPNTAAFNFVLKAMKQTKETEAAEKLLKRMLQGGTESLSDDETYDLVIGMLFESQQVAMQADNSKLAFYALEFMAKWIARGENARPPFLLSVDEGLIVSALATAGAHPESFLGKIYAHASLGNLQKAFGTLHEFEGAHGNSINEAEDLFSPFTTLYPLVVACSKNGYETLDSVYYRLENLSHADPPYKSVTALNCIILGCGNIWDIEHAYQTFDAISSSFGLTPDIHSIML
ncbi:Pentatricopeptide repeat-containing protein [Hibiscus syriacus]|uniref:Pentatricopeptide repeat-containing protein n=1 Tax=Hibiscus syriacus TaxID=106335 RepID=A0A6A3AMX8_HIBSY|nr:Pentatricopeptide repeat-containing protein [Hibiscus syriacus]